jgi:ABC-type nickel/cobalt efflux system permease component RcnA
MIAESFNHMIEAIFSPMDGSISAAAPVGLLLLGLITGVRHSMEADHVAAVSTIVATSSGQNKLRRAPILGLMWGIGHTATLLVAGLIVLLFAITIPENVTGRLEFGVGLMLIFLGATTLTGFNVGRFIRGMIGRGRKHSHQHIHKESGVVHSHEHDHQQDHTHGHKSLIVGMIHGMAGSGAITLVVLSTINSVPLGLAYIAIFGVGSMASMAAMSALIGLPFTRAGNYRRTNLLLRYAAAGITLIIGIGLVYELGIVEQVF